MIKYKFNKDEEILEVSRYLEEVNWEDLPLSGSKKSYSVSYDRIEFVTKDGITVKGQLTLYAPKDDYEEWQMLKGKQVSPDLKQMGLTKDDWELFQQFIEFKRKLRNNG